MKFELGEMDEATWAASTDRVHDLMRITVSNLIETGAWKGMSEIERGEVQTKAICLLMDERDANQAFIDAFDVGETIEKDALRLLIERLLPKLATEPPDDES